MRSRRWSALIHETIVQWLDVDAPRLAAALAYYAIFAMAPLLVIVTAVAGLVFGEAAVRGRLEQQVAMLVGPDAAVTISELVQSVSRPQAGVLATVIGLVTLLIGATGVFVELQNALNAIWRVPKRNGDIWRGLLRERLVSFAMILGVGFLLLVSLILSTAVTAAADFLPLEVSHLHTLLRLADIGLAFGLTTALFAMIFKVLPDVSIHWNDVWLGAAVTSLMFTFGRVLIGLYLGRSAVASAYGAAGSLAVVLIWVYYSTQILFLGAEFTHVYAQRRRGADPKPKLKAK